MPFSVCGCRFSEPVRLAKWAPRERSGIYALLVAEGLGYQVIYLGEAGNLSTLSIDERHPGYPCWLVIAGSVQNLYVSTCLTSSRTPEERKALLNELVAAARPLCNYEARRSPPQSPPQSPPRPHPSPYPKGRGGGKKP